MAKIIWKDVHPVLHNKRAGGVVPRSFTHFARIGDVTLFKSKTRISANLPLAGCRMMVTPKKGQTLDQAARIVARRVQAEVDILAERFQRGLLRP